MPQFPLAVIMSYVKVSPRQLRLCWEETDTIYRTSLKQYSSLTFLFLSVTPVFPPFYYLRSLFIEREYKERILI